MSRHSNKKLTNEPKMIPIEYYEFPNFGIDLSTDDYESFRNYYEKNKNDEMPIDVSYLDPLDIRYILFSVVTQWGNKIRKSTVNSIIKRFTPIMDKIYELVPEGRKNDEFYYANDNKKLENFKELKKDINFSDKNLKPVFEDIIQIYSDFTKTDFEENKAFFHEQWEIIQSELYDKITFLQMVNIVGQEIIHNFILKMEFQEIMNPSEITWQYVKEVFDESY